MAPACAAASSAAESSVAPEPSAVTVKVTPANSRVSPSAKAEVSVNVVEAAVASGPLTETAGASPVPAVLCTKVNSAPVADTLKSPRAVLRAAAKAVAVPSESVPNAT